MPDKSHTFAGVAKWLLEKILARGRVEGEEAAALVLRAFGPRFVTGSRGRRLQVRHQVVTVLNRIGDGQIDYFYSPGRCRLWVTRPG